MKLLILAGIGLIFAGTAFAGVITVPKYDNTAGKLKKIEDGKITCYIFDNREIECLKS